MRESLEGDCLGFAFLPKVSVGSGTKNGMSGPGPSKDLNQVVYS